MLPSCSKIQNILLTQTLLVYEHQFEALTLAVLPHLRNHPHLLLILPLAQWLLQVLLPSPIAIFVISLTFV